MREDSAIRDFVMSRRAKVQPEDVGLPRGARRRVPGLRREEVASLAGVSLDYYVQIERGNVAGVSDEVLAAIARALRLDEAERTHLFDLVRHQTSTRPGHAPPVRVPLSLQLMLDSITAAPAIIQDGALNIIATNHLGRVLYRRILATQEHPNLARYVFLDDDSVRFYDDWDAIADDAAAMLRVETARAPSRSTQQLVDELTYATDAFARRWAAQDVADHRRGPKVVHDAEVGVLHLHYEALEVAALPGVRLFGYTPDPDHPTTTERLRLLASLGDDLMAAADSDVLTQHH